MIVRASHGSFMILFQGEAGSTAVVALVINFHVRNAVIVSLRWKMHCSILLLETWETLLDYCVRSHKIVKTRYKTKDGGISRASFEIVIPSRFRDLATFSIERNGT